MDKHTCKLCFRRFNNGRALGGHMRSHVTSCLPPPPPLLSSSASSDQEEEQETQVGSNSVVLGGGSYGLRENPRKSFRLVDPEFNNSSHLYSSAAVLDGESDSDGSCKQPIGVSRRRSLRRQSPVSSISDTTATTDEDVALCLVMLSRDSWSNTSTTPVKRAHQEQETTEELQSEPSDDEKRGLFSSIRPRKIERGRRSRYQCETCKKVFRSYQALGGHRANHKKLKPTATEDDENDDHCRDSFQEDDCDDGCGVDSMVPIRHECPVCLRVFGSAQALGGHKRVHIVAGSGSSPSPPLLLPHIPSAVFVGGVKLERSFIDLNLPAPID